MSKIIKASRIIGEYRLNQESGVVRVMESIEKNSENLESEQQTVDLNEIELKAEEIIEEAEIEAEEIISRSQFRAEEIREEAYQVGYEEGHTEGYQAALEKINKLSETINTAVEQLKRDFEAEKDRLADDILELVLIIAGRVINTELDINPELINNIIIDMLKDIDNRHEKILIKVNSDLVNYINEAGIEARFKEQKIEFIGDSSLKPGDCIVETNYGGRDGTLQRKLALLEKQLYKGAGQSE